MDEKSLPLYFELFNEIGIIEQLSRARLEAELPKGFLISHFTVLNHLIRVGDGRTPLDMANAFQVPKTTLTHTLGGLEKAGLITTRPNPADGRSKLVWITEDGKAFRNNTIQSMSKNIADFADEFPPELIASIVPELTKIRVYMDRARDSQPPVNPTDP